MRTPNSTIRHRTPVLTAATTIALLLLTAATAAAAPVPNKYVLSGYFGRNVDKTKVETPGSTQQERDVCTVASKHECQRGLRAFGGEAGGFFFPTGIAVNNDPSSSSYEHIYVDDRINRRVEELTAGGQFVSMFGQEVNKLGGNVCTAAEEANCQKGTAGGAPGEFGTFMPSIAVDPATGNVYVADATESQAGELGRRVQVFSSSGTFLRAIGKGVNKNNGTNFCTGAECQPATPQTEEQANNETEAGAFDFATSNAGNALVIGGPSDALYVGDHGRVQQFSSATGASEREVSLSALSSTGLATGVAVDQAGDLFVVDGGVSGVHEYSPLKVLEPVVIDPSSSQIKAVAVDPHGRVGVIDRNGGLRAALYTPGGREISEFSPAFGAATTLKFPGFPEALAFSSSGNAFIINTVNQYVEAYASIVFPEVATCAVAEVMATSATLCAEIDPQGVHARGFFDYGKAPSFEGVTPTAFEGEGETLEAVSSPLTKLLPHQEYVYQALVEAQANGEPLQAHGEELSFETKALPPLVPGTPSALFVTSQSAVLTATLNPEHATTRYHFEYGPCPTLTGCPSTTSTPAETSSVFGQIGTSVELAGLSSNTTYAYRLVAVNEYVEGGTTHEEQTIGAEAMFKTGLTPVPAAETGGYSALTSTSALVAATVDPNGVPTSYAFEVGVYEGAATQYGIAFSGSAGAGAEPVPVSYTLTGLQPGTTYAYRLVIHSGQGETPGATAIFTTLGLPSVLSSPASPPLLATPSIAFPTETKESGTSVKKLTRAQKLKNALKACHKLKGKRRASCIKSAHKRYGPVKKKKKKRK
jgi:hypothetical protein